MKKRNLFLAVLLVLALLFLGLGYAGLTNNLSFKGTIGSSLNNNNLDVRFANDNSTPADTSVSADNVKLDEFVYESKSVSFSVTGFNAENQSATIYLKVVNNSKQLEEYNAKLSSTFGITMTHLENDVEIAAEGSQSGNVYTGKHYTVSVSYEESYFDRNGVEKVATGDINSGSPILEAVSDTSNNEYIYIKIIVETHSPIVDELPPHYFTVTFDAETIPVVE